MRSMPVMSLRFLKRYDFNLDMNGQKHLLRLVQYNAHAKKAVEHQVDVANQKEGAQDWFDRAKIGYNTILAVQKVHLMLPLL